MSKQHYRFSQIKGNDNVKTMLEVLQSYIIGHRSTPEYTPRVPTSLPLQANIVTLLIFACILRKLPALTTEQYVFSTRCFGTSTHACLDEGRNASLKCILQAV